MARSVVNDFLQSHPFWLMDIPQAELLSGALLSPIMGFATCSAPEMSVELMTVTEGNWPFPRKVVKKANVNTLSMSRGSRFYDSDFWRWMIYSVTGESPGWYGALFGGNTPRRDLLLIQYFPHVKNDPAGGLLGTMLTGGAALLTEGGGAGALMAAGKGAAAGLPAVISKFCPGPFEFALRIPAKSWIIHGAVPTRYKAASDFDAKSADISLLELDLEYESFEEFAVGA